MVSLLSLHSVCGFHGTPSVFTGSRPAWGEPLGTWAARLQGQEREDFGVGGGGQGGLEHLKNQIKSWLSNAFCRP